MRKQQMYTVASAIIDMIKGLCLWWSDQLILTLIKSEETVFKEILRGELCNESPEVARSYPGLLGETTPGIYIFKCA